MDAIASAVPSAEPGSRKPANRRLDQGRHQACLPAQSGHGCRASFPPWPRSTTITWPLAYTSAIIWAATSGSARRRPTPPRNPARSRICPPNFSWARIWATTSSTWAFTTRWQQAMNELGLDLDALLLEEHEPGLGTVAWAGSPPVSWIPWPRWRFLRWATASAMSSAFSNRPSSMAGSREDRQVAAATATRGKWRAPSGHRGQTGWPYRTLP